jgi:hypothetical protein
MASDVETKMKSLIRSEEHCECTAGACGDHGFGAQAKRASGTSEGWWRRRELTTVRRPPVDCRVQPRRRGQTSGWNERRLVEAAGVEPASESTSSWDSTCVSASGFSYPA